MRCVVQSCDRLGEGPVWSAPAQRLYWFDIKGSRLSWFIPATGEHLTLALPFRASAAAVRAGGGLLAATEKGLAHIDPDSGAAHVVEPIDLGDGFRSNDGKIDMLGRFWWSSMDDNGGERPGAIFVSTPGAPTRRMLGGIHIPNTLSFSPDGAVLYIADSKLGVIKAYASEDLADAQEFARSESGAPDGAAVDEDGYLWNCQWGASRIVRYAPDGSIDRIVSTPVSQPTSCAFGGADLATLYITSAWDDLTPDARAAQPLAGSLFAIEPGVRGLKLPVYAG